MSINSHWLVWAKQNKISPLNVNHLISTKCQVECIHWHEINLKQIRQALTGMTFNFLQCFCLIMDEWKMYWFFKQLVYYLQTLYVCTLKQVSGSVQQAQTDMRPWAGSQHGSVLVFQTKIDLGRWQTQLDRSPAVLLMLMNISQAI